MATYGWRTNTPVERGLYEEGHRFDFYQAVRLLELLAPEKAKVGEQPDPAEEAVRFRSKVRQDYPSTDVEEIRPARHAGEPAEMVVNVMGLAGALGPLPAVYTELLLDREAKKDPAFRDFLDVFNHRFVSLFYRARKKYRAALQDQPPDESLYARTLFALIGLGSPGVRNRLGVPDRALLKAAGLLAHRSRPMIGLERLVEEHFEVPVKVAPFLGRWFDLEPESRTAIGRTGFNRRLGQGAILGQRVWVQDSAFELELGPMSLGQYLDLLPVGKGFESVCELARYYAGDELGCTLRLALRADEVPRLRLGRAGDGHLGWSSRLPGRTGSRLRLGSAGGMRLGWTTWLQGSTPRGENACLVLQTDLYRGPDAVWKPDPLEDGEGQPGEAQPEETHLIGTGEAS